MKTQYITDNFGKKVSVILPIRDYEKIMAELEEREDIKAYDRAKAPQKRACAVQTSLKRN